MKLGNCKHGDCPDHYGDPAAWCDRCRANWRKPDDTPAPEQQAGDGVGLVAALEGETQDFESGVGCFIDAEDAVKVAAPYESRLAAAEKRCAEMEALLREVELEAVDIRRKPGNVLKQIREFLSGTSNTGAAWQAERDKQNETIDYLQACGMQVQSEMEQLSEQWGIAEQGWLADRQALADLRGGIDRLAGELKTSSIGTHWSSRLTGAYWASCLTALLATPASAGDAAAGQGDDGDDGLTDRSRAAIADCPICQGIEDNGGSSHYHCAKCGEETGMMGHYAGEGKPWSCKPDDTDDGPLRCVVREVGL